MTPAVCIVPGSVCLVTAKAVNRMYRFVPKRGVVRMLDYCLRLAASKFAGQIRLHEYLFMSNHAHLLLTDVAGVLPDFMQFLDSTIARNLNAMRGMTGKNFEGYSFQVIDADDAERQLSAAVYILNNPCAAHLVSRSRHWKSTSSLRLRYGAASSVTRPAAGMYKGALAHLRGPRSARSGRAAYARSKAPKSAAVTLHPLPGFSPTEVSDRCLRALVLERLATAEGELIAQRRHNGSSVVGWRRVVAAHFNDMPASSRELFDVRPTVAASSPARRAAAQARQRAFVTQYNSSLKAFVDGVRNVVFPHGTWLMVKRFRVPCEPAAP